MGPNVIHGCVEYVLLPLRIKGLHERWEMGDYGVGKFGLARFLGRSCYVKLTGLADPRILTFLICHVCLSYTRREAKSVHKSRYHIKLVSSVG